MTKSCRNARFGVFPTCPGKSGVETQTQDWPAFQRGFRVKQFECQESFQAARGGFPRLDMYEWRGICWAVGQEERNTKVYKQSALIDTFLELKRSTQSSGCLLSESRHDQKAVNHQLLIAYFHGQSESQSPILLRRTRSKIFDSNITPSLGGPPILVS